MRNLLRKGIFYLLFLLLIISDANAELSYTIKKENSFADSPTTLYIIQDIHADSATQSAIGNLIDTLVAHESANLYLEGAVDRINADWFRNFPDHSIRDMVAFHSMKNGKISGAEYTAIVSNTPITIYGVDDMELYKKNLNFLEESLIQNDKSRVFVEKLRDQLKGIVNSLDNENLNGLFKLVTTTRHDNILEYYISLFSYLEKLGVSLPADSYIHPVRQNYSVLTQSNPKILEQQRLILIKSLAGKNKNSVKQLMYALDDYDVIQSLIRKYRTHQFDEKKIVQLIAYSNSLTALSSITYSSLQEELFSAQKRLIASDLDFDPVIRVTAMLSCFPLIENYFHSALTRSEYNFLSNYLYKINQHSFRYGAFAEVSRQLGQFDSIISKDNFYSSALSRDIVIAEKSVSHIRQTPLRKHVLVVGGFHIDGICEILERESVSYQVILPKIEYTAGFEDYLHKYYLRLGIQNGHITPHFIEKAQDILSFKMLHLAVSTHLKHILSESATPNFKLETQFLMQGLHIVLNGTDVRLDSYPEKQMSFLPPIQTGEHQIYPVVFETQTIPPLFVTITHKDQTPLSNIPTTLYSDSVSQFHFSIIGPDTLRDHFRTTQDVVSFGQLDAQTQRELVSHIEPFLRTQQEGSMEQLLESIFLEFDPFVHLRQYSIGGFNDTRSGLLSPTTAAVYKNGTGFLGILDRSGPSLDGVDVFNARMYLHSIAMGFLVESGLSKKQTKEFRDVLPLMYGVRSDVEVKYPADFITNYRELGKNFGDLHYRYYERLTLHDMQGLVQRLFQETTGFEGNPYAIRNRELRDDGLSRTKRFFTQWSLEGAMDSLLSLSAILPAIIKMEEAYFPFESAAEYISLLGRTVEIDDSDILEQKVIQENRPYYFLPSDSQTLPFDLKVWGEQVLLDRIIKLFAMNEVEIMDHFTPEMLRKILDKHPDLRAQIQSVTFMVKEKSVFTDVSREDVESLFEDPFYERLLILREYNLFEVHSYEAGSPGMSLLQMPDETLDKLVDLRDAGGIILSRGEPNYFSLNLINIPTIRMVTIKTPLVRDHLAYEIGSHLVQYVPAGLAPVIGFGFTQQSARQFSEALRSNEYKQLLRKYDGDEEQVLALIREKFAESYLPVHRIIEGLLDKTLYDYGIVRSTRTLKVLPDGYTTFVNQVILPGEGTLQMDIWRSENPQGDTLEEIRSNYERKYPDRQILLMTNGGFFITSAIAKREGLSEDVVGTNLGLSVQGGKILSPPLFNKGAIFQTKDGRIVIRRVSINKAGGVWDSHHTQTKGLFWADDTINLSSEELIERGEKLKDKILLYTPLYDVTKIPEPALKGRVLLHVVGNKVTTIQKEPEEMKNLICGICLAVPNHIFEQRKSFIQVGSTVEFELDLGEELKHINTALESGPFLVRDGKIDYKPGTKELNLEEGGWLTENSKRTQASDVHNQVIRSARIAAGVKGDTLVMVAVDSRIQESMGAGHRDMAEIMHDLGVDFSTEYDGGSSVALYLPHLSDPALTNSSWSGNTEKPYDYPRYPRFSQPRPLGSAFIYYVEKDTIPELELKKDLGIRYQEIIEQSM